MKRLKIILDLDVLNEWMRLGKDVWRLVLKKLRIRDKYILQHEFWMDMKDEIYVRMNKKLIPLWKDYDIQNSIDSYQHEKYQEIANSIEKFFSDMPLEGLEECIEPLVSNLYSRYLLHNQIFPEYLNESVVKEDIRGDIYSYCESYAKEKTLPPFSKERIALSYHRASYHHYPHQESNRYDIEKMCVEDDPTCEYFVTFMHQEGY